MELTFHVFQQMTSLEDIFMVYRNEFPGPHT